MDDIQILLLMSYVLLSSVYEKMKEKIEIGHSTTGFKARMSTWSKGIGLRGNKNIQKG